MAGTFSSKKTTYQVSDLDRREEMTGIGSVRDVKEMKIEFDVFKRLSVGQAILIDKFSHREDLFQVWRPGSFLSNKNNSSRFGFLKRFLSVFNKVSLIIWKAIKPQSFAQALKEYEGEQDAISEEKNRKLWEEQVRRAYPEWYEELQKIEGFYKGPNKRNQDYQFIEGELGR